MIFFINHKHPAINKETPRSDASEDNHRGDISSLQNELQHFQEYFSVSDPLQNSTEHNWQLLTDVMQKAISDTFHPNLQDPVTNYHGLFH